jgi:hypothetical protein
MQWIACDPDWSLPYVHVTCGSPGQRCTGPQALLDTNPTAAGIQGSYTPDAEVAPLETHHFARLRSETIKRPITFVLLTLALALGELLVGGAQAYAHAIGGKDAAFVAATRGPDPFPFLYLGAKHMVTGYDHLLFVVGVIFFLFRLKQIVLYVTMFSIGHSITLLAGVLLNFHVDAFLVDAVIGLSVVYKAFDNLGGFKTVLGFQPNTKAVVLGFGLVHGFGLATKLQALHLNPNGLAANLVSFNVGVEIGQIIALSLILVAMAAWRRTQLFSTTAASANVLLMIAGFVLAGQQFVRYFFNGVA